MIYFLLSVFLDLLKVDDTAYKRRYEINETLVNRTSESCKFSYNDFRLGSRYYFILRNCKVGDCHAIVDNSYSMKWGFPQNQSLSIFKNVSIVGANQFVSPSGVTFRPTTSTVQIGFQTQSCHDFYTLHPFELVENCSLIAPFSDIIRGLPFCNDK